MIKVNTKDFVRVSSIFEIHQPEDKFVVLVLHTGKLSKEARESLEEDGMGYHFDKINEINLWMNDNCFLTPPVISVKDNKKIKFLEGRHRSIVAYSKKYETFPVITLERYVDDLKDYWGNKELAFTVYDFKSSNNITVK